jgi:hypothetical protein
MWKGSMRKYLHYCRRGLGSWMEDDSIGECCTGKQQGRFLYDNAHVGFFGRLLYCG